MLDNAGKYLCAMASTAIANTCSSQKSAAGRSWQVGEEKSVDVIW
jgi:hypothetical protein